ncbi:MAG: hypothetical protein ACYDCL_12885 [Myxococcales bacterium]
MILSAAGCRQPAHASSSGGGSSGTTGSAAASSTGSPGTSTGTSSGGSGGGSECPVVPHCANNYFWSVDCDGGVDGGACPEGTACNATGSACVTGRPSSCSSDAECPCLETCSSTSACAFVGNHPESPCSSDLDCGPSCQGLFCLDGGCYPVGCGPVSCAPDCACSGFGVCDCPKPDAGPTCTSYLEVQCRPPCAFPLPDGGCDCQGQVLDPSGDCVECVQDSGCPHGLHCDLDPSDFSTFEGCVECTASDQCDAGSVCDLIGKTCVPDCRLGGGCDAGCSSSGVCGQCNSDADCPQGSACALWPDGGIYLGGLGNILGSVPPTCRPHCHGDADCPSEHPLCDADSGDCIDCLQNTDCFACKPHPGASCYGGSCVLEVVCY